MFDPTKYPHLSRALAAYDAQFEHDEHGAPATEQFHDWNDALRAETRDSVAREIIDMLAKEVLLQSQSYRMGSSDRVLALEQMIDSIQKRTMNDEA